tara:strand:+ start:37885 stop:38433 length:549 start_codon:yes stop_codon:yes gene_type:complete
MNLEGKKVAILATDGFEQSELESPRDALLETGATPTVVSPKPDSIRGWSGGEWGDNVDVDVALEDANPADYAALVLPGGVLNPDALRTDDRAVDFVRHFVDTGKPIGAICHGPWTLIDADGVKGRKVTSWPSVRTDLQNAGAKWEDSEVVVDKGLVTSRKPDDLPAFNAKLIEEVAEGRHAA